MSLIKSQIEGSRRPLAVGIWSFLVLLMPLAGTHVSSELSFWVLILVSLFCSVAVLIVDDNRKQEEPDSSFRRHIPVTISVMIPVLWTIFLIERSRPLETAASVILGLAPVVIAAMWHTSRPGMNARVIPATDQPAKQSYQLETGNEAAPERIETFDSELTVPFSQKSLFVLDEFAAESEPDSGDPEESDDVTHWLKRSKTTDGEIIEGGVRVAFADGQRDLTVHIAFCPPFQCIPSIETEDLDGTGLEIRVAAAFPFGTRLSVRRSAASKATQLPNSMGSGRIGFVAIAANVRRVA
jgi:hypothetical protein